MATATFQQTAVLGLYTETPLHCGAEGGTGYVDLPVQRERHTLYPVIPGSSIKGTLRDELAVPLGRARIDALFGETTWVQPQAADGTVESGPGKQQTRPGTVSFGDGILVAFPVRSSGAPFHWVTCPFVLERAFRALGAGAKIPAAPARNEAWGAAVESVLLEEIAVTVRREETFFSGKAGSGLAELLKLLPDSSGFAYTRGIFGSRLLILSDEDFRELVETGTEILTRIKLNALGTTANLKEGEYPEITDPFGRQGNLFVEEVVPSETLFLSALRSTGEGAAEIEKAFLQRKVIRLGGDETIGRGLTHATYVGGGR